MTPQALHQSQMKAEGRCVRCCQPNDTTTTRCQFCMDRDNTQARSRRAILVALGKCQGCRKVAAQQGYTRCFQCRVAKAACDRRRRARRAA